MSLEISTILAEIKTGRVPASGQKKKKRIGIVVQTQLFGKMMIKNQGPSYLLGLSQDSK